MATAIERIDTRETSASLVTLARDAVYAYDRHVEARDRYKAKRSPDESVAHAIGRKARELLQTFGTHVNASIATSEFITSAEAQLGVVGNQRSFDGNPVRDALPIARMSGLVTVQEDIVMTPIELARRVVEQHDVDTQSVVN